MATSLVDIETTPEAIREDEQLIEAVEAIMEKAAVSVKDEIHSSVTETWQDIYNFITRYFPVILEYREDQHRIYQDLEKLLYSLILFAVAFLFLAPTSSWFQSSSSSSSTASTAVTGSNKSSSLLNTATPGATPTATSLSLETKGARSKSSSFWSFLFFWKRQSSIQNQQQLQQQQQNHRRSNSEGTGRTAEFEEEEEEISSRGAESIFNHQHVEETEEERFNRHYYESIMYSNYRKLVLPPTCRKVEAPALPPPPPPPPKQRAQQQQQHKKESAAAGAAAGAAATTAGGAVVTASSPRTTATTSSSSSAAAPPLLRRKSTDKDDSRDRQEEDNPAKRLRTYFSHLVHLIRSFFTYDYAGVGYTILLWMQGIRMYRRTNSRRDLSDAEYDNNETDDDDDDDDDDDMNTVVEDEEDDGDDASLTTSPRAEVEVATATTTTTTVSTKTAATTPISPITATTTTTTTDESTLTASSSKTKLAALVAAAALESKSKKSRKIIPHFPNLPRRRSKNGLTSSSSATTTPTSSTTTSPLTPMQPSTVAAAAAAAVTLVSPRGIPETNLQSQRSTSDSVYHEVSQGESAEIDTPNQDDGDDILSTTSLSWLSSSSSSLRKSIQQQHHSLRSDDSMEDQLHPTAAAAAVPEIHDDDDENDTQPTTTAATAQTVAVGVISPATAAVNAAMLLENGSDHSRTSAKYYFESAQSKESLKQLSVQVPVPDKNGYILGDEFLPHDGNQQRNQYYTPLLVFVNSRAGPQQGHLLITQLRRLLNPIQVWDLANGSPEPILESFCVLSRLRILVCGGDGTVSWIISALEALNLKADQAQQQGIGAALQQPRQSERKKWPPIAILPLGTGNDLARIHGWGGGYNNESLLTILEQVSESYISLLDRWEMVIEDKTSSSSSGRGSKRTSKKAHTETKSFFNYLGVGADAQAALQVHFLRQTKPQWFFSRLVNKAWYGVFGAEDIIKASSVHVRKEITLYADGVEVPLPPDSQGIILLNIDSYAGGVPLWSHGTNPPSRQARGRSNSCGNSSSPFRRSHSLQEIGLHPQQNQPEQNQRQPHFPDVAPYNHYHTYHHQQRRRWESSIDRIDSMDDLQTLVLSDDERYARVTACEHPSSCQDGLLDVVSIRGAFHLGQIKVGLSNAQRLCQCREAKIVIKNKVAVQIDGEPWRQDKCVLHVRRKKDYPAVKMLHRSPDESGGVEMEMSKLLDWAEERRLIDSQVHSILMKEFSRRIESKTRQRRVRSQEATNVLHNLKRAIGSTSNMTGGGVGNGGGGGGMATSQSMAALNQWHNGGIAF